MEENENKKPDEVEEPKPAEEPVESSPSPEEAKEEGGFKAKVGAFFSVKRNKIIVGACSAAAVVALIVGLSVGLTQCSNGDNGNAFSSNSNSEGKSSSDGGSSSKGESSSSHTHDYGTAWKSDATKHWHECACGEKSGVADHTFTTEKVVVTKATPTSSGTKGYQCTVCEYAKDTEAYTPYVTESNWAAALKFDGDKFTLTYPRNNGSTDKFVKNGNAVYWSNSADANEDEYFTKETEGETTKYYIYKKDSSGSWTKTEDTDEDKYYDWYGNREINSEIFKGNLTFAGLTFSDDKQGYTASYKDRSNEDVSAELYFNNARLTKAIKTTGSSSLTYLFSDEAEEINVPHVHDYGTEWKSDGSKHWHECSCGSKSEEGAHTYGSLEVIQKATPTTKGIKAKKCTVCDAVDEASKKEFDPYMDNYDWDAAIGLEDDFTMRWDSYEYEGFDKLNRHTVRTITKHGDVAKEICDQYQYNNDWLYDSDQTWVSRTPSEDATDGYIYHDYVLDDASKWEESRTSESAYQDVAEPWVAGQGESVSDYTFNEDLECYEKKDGSGKVLRQIYFDCGKAYKVFDTETAGGKTYDTWEIEHSSPELSLPDPETHTHAWSEAYSSDYLYHWHECACGARNEKKAHDFTGFTVTKSATKTENGTKSSPCSTCSGSSGEREYTPYLTSASGWTAAFADYKYSYKVTTTSYKEDDMYDTDVVSFSFSSQVVDRYVATQNSDGAGVDEKGHNYRYIPDYVYESHTDSNWNTTWTRTADADGNFEKYTKLSVFASYASEDIDSYQIVNDGDDSYYTRDDNKIKIYFDMGRIVRLEDTTGTYKKVIEVSYSNLYEIAVPTVQE